MGIMTEYERRMIELEKKKVKILTDIYKELVYMNRPGIEKIFEGMLEPGEEMGGNEDGRGKEV